MVYGGRRKPLRMVLKMARFWATPALLVAAAGRAAALTDAQHHQKVVLELSDGSLLPFDSELPGPRLDDGTPTKLYSLSLGRTWHNHTASAELSAAVAAKKLARRNWQERRSLYLSFEDTPLFPGWGTHFAYVYAGTPPQRVSVIIDTGSHFTAFPCAECRNCGSHTDPRWDHSKSTTSKIVSCSECHGSFRCKDNKRCGFSQKYSEGSSWSAYQVEDVLWVGELTLEESAKLRHDESAYSVQFMFGCIESQTGLFKTQLADGIMGMSADSHTLVWQLASAGKIKERTFSLCFGLNGGTMVIGGYDPRLTKPGAQMAFTPLTKGSGWFTVKVLDITLDGISIETDPSAYQRGKGIIVDSGTTDTYLPRTSAKGFSNAWQKITGNPYKTCHDNHFCMKLTPTELKALPTVTIHMDDGVEVHVRPEAYMDGLGRDNAYAPRIYLTESMGGVLGANVMRDHNVVFDYDNHRVGFVEGKCDYNSANLDVAPVSDGAQENAPELAVGRADAEGDVDCVTAKERMSKCDAACPPGLRAPQAFKGHETWMDVVIVHPTGSGKNCPEQAEKELRECVKHCAAASPDQSKDGVGAVKAVKGDAKKVAPAEQMAADITETYCSIEQELWTACSADCQQERYMDDACEKEAEARHCHIGDACSTSKAGLLLSMHLTLTVSIGQDGIERGHSELWMRWIGLAVGNAVASLLDDVSPGNVEVTMAAVDPKAADAATLSAGASVPCTAVVEMHLTPKVDNAAANRVSQVVNPPSFPGLLTTALETATEEHWLLPGVTVAVTATQRVEMFVASNREVYLPQESNRLQSASPRSRGVGPLAGLGGTVATGLMVLAAIAALVFRAKSLRPGDEGVELSSQVGLLARGRRVSVEQSASVLEAAGDGRSVRRAVNVARDST